VLLISLQIVALTHHSLTHFPCHFHIDLVYVLLTPYLIKRINLQGINKTENAKGTCGFTTFGSAQPPKTADMNTIVSLIYGCQFVGKLHLYGLYL